MKEAALMNDICIHENSIAHLKFTAQWQDDIGKHTAIQHIKKFHIWRDMDLLPQPLLNDILHHPVGKGELHIFKADELVPARQKEKLVTLPIKNFNDRLKSGESVQPRAGRFYPMGWFRGVNGIYSENMFPARLVEMTENNIVVDFNHPLAGQELVLGVEILEIFPPSDEHGGRCTDVIEEFLGHGPGMQVPFNDTSTDFIVDSVFERVDESSDEVFYKNERKVHHLDAYARATICDIYSGFVKPGYEVLDLMASWESHIPEGITDVKVTGLGMNEIELQSNPVLNEHVIHDLNNQPLLTYTDESFDLVICTASVEYLTNPLTVFEEIKRVLKPGGQCIITFSNRWFPSKSIKLWSEMHEFERLGLVIEYFKQSGWDKGINTFSSKGLHRPVDDPHYAQTQISDPVYAVWCQKS